MTTKNRVEALLKHDTRYRDSDKRLLLAFWHTEGLHLTDEQRQMFMEKCSPAESITRQRRILRSKYPGSKAVEEDRYERYRVYKHNAGYVDVFAH